jgi:hypothetical protein
MMDDAYAGSETPRTRRVLRKLPGATLGIQATELVCTVRAGATLQTH